MQSLLRISKKFIDTQLPVGYSFTFFDIVTFVMYSKQLSFRKYSMLQFPTFLPFINEKNNASLFQSQLWTQSMKLPITSTRLLLPHYTDFFGNDLIHDTSKNKRSCSKNLQNNHVFTNDAVSQIQSKQLLKQIPFTSNEAKSRCNIGTFTFFILGLKL